MTLKDLTHFTALNVSRNQLAEFAVALESLKALVNLDLSDNPLTVFPPAPWPPLSVSVRHLDLSGISFLQVPTALGSWARLRSLGLRCHQPSILNAELESFMQPYPYVPRLDLSQNQLAVVPPAFGQLQGLTHPDLAHNQLTTIPTVLAQLADLEVLDLSHNQ